MKPPWRVYVTLMCKNSFASCDIETWESELKIARPKADQPTASVSASSKVGVGPVKSVKGKRRKGLSRPLCFPFPLHSTLFPPLRAINPGSEYYWIEVTYYVRGNLKLNPKVACGIIRRDMIRLSTAPDPQKCTAVRLEKRNKQISNDTYYL